MSDKRVEQALAVLVVWKLKLVDVVQDWQGRSQLFQQVDELVDVLVPLGHETRVVG